MALSDSLNQLAKKPLRIKAALLFFVLLVFGFIYYQFRYSSLSDQEDSLESKQSSLSAQQRKLDDDLSKWRELTAKKDELQQTIADNLKALPFESELPAFLDHLQRKAGDAGVTIRKWENLAEEQVDVYIRVPVKVGIHGSYHQIMQFFFLLGPKPKDTLELDKEGEEKPERVNERIVSIENLELSKAAFDEGVLKLEAEFIAATFRQAAPKADEAKDPKKAGQQRAPAKPSGTPAANRGGTRNSKRRPARRRTPRMTRVRASSSPPVDTFHGGAL